MTQLYNINKEIQPHEITNSLAQSIKRGFFLPTEKKLTILETEVTSLKKEIEKNKEELSLDISEKIISLESDIKLLEKLLRKITFSLLAIMAVIIASLVYVFSWY